MVGIGVLLVMRFESLFLKEREFVVGIEHRPSQLSASTQALVVASQSSNTSCVPPAHGSPAWDSRFVCSHICAEQGCVVVVLVVTWCSL